MPEETYPSGLSSLSEELREALRATRPDYQRMTTTLEMALEKDLPTPVRSLLLRTLAKVYATQGDWPAACNAARTAYTEIRSRTQVDVPLLIDATHTYVNVLERADHMNDATATMRAAVELALPHATPPQLAQLLEMRATLVMRQALPHND